jgi:predicted nuclease of predicted toxin-antitoxin system
MTLWFDAHLSPGIAGWVQAEFHVATHALRDLGLRDASDLDIFSAARRAGAVVVTKDRDFADLVGRLGAPPQVLLLSCGNTSNMRLRALFASSLRDALEALARGEPLVEMLDRQSTPRH